MSPVPEAQIAHHIPGRLRLRIPRLRDEPALEAALTRGIRAHEDVIDVVVRPATGSVVVWYRSNGAGGAAFVESLSPAVRVEPATLDPASQRPPDASLGEAAARWTKRRWAALDERLRRSSGGALDVGTIVPAFFLLLGVRQFLLEPTLAAVPWYVGFYYAFESFCHYYGCPDRRGADAELRETAEPDRH